MNKNDLRISMRARKIALSDNEKAASSEAVFNLLEHTAAFIMSENILIYHSLPDELSTLAFIDKWHTSKHLFLPRVNGADLEILPYSKSRLHNGAFNIAEPDGDDTTDISQIDMVVVPAVAYDRRGNRIGRGKGYYDRLLDKAGVIKVGVAYDFQLVDKIDTEPHDISVDYVITEKGILRTSRKHP